MPPGALQIHLPQEPANQFQTGKARQPGFFAAQVNSLPQMPQASILATSPLLRALGFLDMVDPGPEHAW